MNYYNNPHVLSHPDESTTIPDSRGVGYVYYQHMQKYKEKIAQIDPYTQTEETFGELLQRCVRTAITMQSKGIKPGDIISSCSFNSLDTCVPYVASFLTGAIMAAVDPTLSVKEITYLFKQVTPKMIFVSKEAVTLIEKVVQGLGFDIIIVVYGETNIYTPFIEFLVTSSNENEFTPRKPENLHETALVIFSSGTSGRPKGICHTHLSIQSFNVFEETSVNSTLVCFCSLYWSVFHMFFHRSIMNGFKRLIIPRFDVNNPWEIFKHKIHFSFLCPPQTLLFFKYDKPENLDLNNLETLKVGGNYVSAEFLLKLRALFPKTNIHYTYGQTEIFSSMFVFPKTPYGRELFQKYPNSVGLPIKGFCYKIVDINSEEILGPNQIGELRVLSKSSAKGYYNADSSEMFDSDNWLKTGDLAYYNEEKCFFITDRIKESFKYLGYHISPVEIEDTLLSHPFIKHAVVFGMPHRTDDNHPMAIVELNTGAKAVTPEEIIEYVEKNVEDKNRLRGGVKIVKSLPFTVTNKINRNKVKYMVQHNEI